jgi:ribosome-binding protein aMBF1 (putative translation factor)
VGQAPRELNPYASVVHFLGSELRRYRQRADLSQEALGQRVPCDKALISRTECGQQVPSETVAAAIASTSTPCTPPSRTW